MSNENDARSRPVPRWIPCSLIAFSSLAMVLPAVMLRRYRATHVSTAPPRRSGGRVVIHPVSIPPRRVRQLPSSPAPSVERTPPNVSEQDHFNAPLYTFKAFAAATAIVVSGATASVVGAMAYLDVRNTTEFAARMRIWVSQTMPLLTAKIYRRPTSHDSDPGDPVLLAASTPQHESPTPTTLDHDAAQQRLADAFDKGGFDAWAEAAVKEMEAEIEVERSRKSKTT